MITRIDIDGFKTFEDFKLELAPFQVIIGSNGAGKSNLFDALRLLSVLARHPASAAFRDRKARGTAREQFMLLPNGQTVTKMRMAVEILLDQHLVQQFGDQLPIRYTRLRYELEIRRGPDDEGLERPYIAHESLAAIPRGNDSWLRRHIGAHRADWLPAAPIPAARQFISTEREGDQTVRWIHPDGGLIRKRVRIDHDGRTALSYMNVPTFPHGFALYNELESMHSVLQLEPAELRKATAIPGPQMLGTNGKGLAGVLARMQAEDPELLHDVSRDLGNLVPGIFGLEVVTDEERGEYLVRAHTQDGRVFSSRVLSDGTLRLLALITLKNDPHYHGILCVEEPENGVHPFRLKNMARLLCTLATDFADSNQRDEPLRQVLINTHSPLLVSQLSDAAGRRPEIVFAYMVTRLPGDNQPPRCVTRMVPVHADRQVRQELEIEDPEGAYTLRQVLDYLDSADVGEARAELAKGAG